MAQTDHDSRSEVERTSQSRLGTLLVPSQPSTDGSNRATPPDSTHQCRLGPPLVAEAPVTEGGATANSRARFWGRRAAVLDRRSGRRSRRRTDPAPGPASARVAFVDTSLDRSANRAAAETRAVSMRVIGVCEPSQEQSVSLFSRLL
ncbi:hypothetical protein CYV19_07320 [Natronobacterium gregoryi SP2]|uniref:Uncharacterized protein n=1 Tax=Natronobacterium gregoryi (strain ATCC 43098 / DSM 3393 / CCM 3738 / CIP 104747 / IAM 13177 / JCM 8860 / NBRC 102187 / NCIMB 2189 / SP2) TaxID=797304 RepID=A0A2J4JG42_NATGS|nr:hypothetical protein CYV19_07320 [Natronobacterium gregoryi SP2]